MLGWILCVLGFHKTVQAAFDHKEVETKEEKDGQKITVEKPSPLISHTLFCCTRKGCGVLKTQP